MGPDCVPEVIDGLGFRLAEGKIDFSLRNSKLCLITVLLANSPC
jgi:hypothetical protein